MEVVGFGGLPIDALNETSRRHSAAVMATARDKQRGKIKVR
jgi:hypothetical protein